MSVGFVCILIGCVCLFLAAFNVVIARPPINLYILGWAFVVLGALVLS